MSNITSFRGGPGYLVWNGITWKLRTDWKVTNPDQFVESPSATGVGMTKIVSDKLGKISAVPKIFKASLAAQIAALFPYTTNTTTGGLMRPSSDLPAVIHARNGGTSNLGLTGTAYAAFLSKMPAVTFAPDKPLVDAMELTYLQALGSNVGDAASLFGTANATYTEPQFAPSDELYDRYTLGLGVTALAGGATTNGASTVSVTSTAGLLVGQAISGTGIPAATTVASITDGTHLVLSANATATGSSLALTTVGLPIVADKDGIKFTPVATPEWIKPAQEPTRDARLVKVAATLEFRPHNMDVDDFYSIYFPETVQQLGESFEQLGYPANITGAKSGGLNLLMPTVTRAKSGQEFSTKTPRQDKVVLDVIDTYSGGAWQPLFTFGVNA